MKVKLCGRCPYTPRDLDDHYNPVAAHHACARCDGEQGKIRMYYPRETYRRRICSIVPSIFSIPQRSGAPCAAESSVSSGTIPGDRTYVRGSAPIASSFGAKTTATGCTRFEPHGAAFSE